MNTAGMQQGVADEVNNRMAKAAQEIAAKYERGEGGHDESVDGPSGSAYKAQIETQEKMVSEAKAQKARENQNKEQHAREIAREQLLEGEEGEDEDNELRTMREQRLKQLKNAHREKLENIGKGHGQYREIVQDEFLTEVTGSFRVVCQFYHREFPRCAIMDHHLKILSERHIETKFIKIDAEKTPFFVDKLKIFRMPTLCLFNDGICYDKIIGFDGVSDLMPEGKEDEFPTIMLARQLGMRMAIDKSKIVDDGEKEANLMAKMEAMRKKGLSEMMSARFEDEDDDFDDLDDL